MSSLHIEYSFDILSLMELVLEDTKKRSITHTEDISFAIKHDDLYVLSISARCKGEKQVGSTDDEDLRVEIDGRKFGELSNSNRYFDCPAAFSGGKLHNSKETIYFFIRLTKGEHVISLISDKIATFESCKIYRIDSIKSLNKIEIASNIIAEDGERYPWMTFVFVDLAVSSMDISLLLKKRFIDSDDVKVIIDGKVQRNFRNQSILHKFWYFISNNTVPLQTTSFTPNLSQGLHYIELWADRMPTLHLASVSLGSRVFANKIQKYIPNKFKYDYNKLDEFIIKATSYWNDFFLHQKYPLPKVLDPSLVKALLYRESRLGYYPNSEIIDVMQVWDPRNPSRKAILGETSANEFVTPKKISHIKYSYPGNKTPSVTTQEDSIFWGVRWLFYKAQHLQEDQSGNIKSPYIRKWRSWREAIRAYNGNPELVDEYVKEIFLIYETGIDLEGNILWEG